jgi:hypothetical protein
MVILVLYPSGPAILPQEALLPTATRDSAVYPTPRQDDGTDDRAAYYASHLGRAVQHYQILLW